MKLEETQMVRKWFVQLRWPLFAWSAILLCATNPPSQSWRRRNAEV